ncbi:uncharacterized protein MONBRDRAFT_25748 [Monosiga brevicollis MX1]|uniref:Uncharacterized protein n=1 Tax=Monosiga brevicollis TaxID=81824 RepID=A9V0B2_MONBE|nr:uncharacterized protein MONBRDRAFT_25748 [Monosiga brevicollis MX1]EDQ88979.1 predicted protein [Monosiga brevicollis MX1]|eukprot:XP_001746084.1 hypothetical protein [Monosiga brevicollis MX1]
METETSRRSSRSRAEPDKPKREQVLAFSHRIYFLSIALRAWLTLSVNTSYLHPDEGDGVRQLQGDLFSLLTANDRVRSSVWPLLTIGLPKFIMSCLFGPDIALKPELLLCSTRVFMLILTFVTDYAIRRTCLHLGLDHYATLAMLGSSVAMIVFHTRFRPSFWSFDIYSNFAGVFFLSGSLRVHGKHVRRDLLIEVLTTVLLSGACLTFFDTVLSNWTELSQGRWPKRIIVPPLFGLRRQRMFFQATAPNQIGGLHAILLATVFLGVFVWWLLDVSASALANPRSQFALEVNEVVWRGHRPKLGSNSPLVSFVKYMSISWALGFACLVLSGHDIAIWDLSGLIVPVAIVFGTRTFGRIAVNSSPLAWIALNLCLVCYYGTLLQSGVTPALKYVYSELQHDRYRGDIQSIAVYINVPSARPYLLPEWADDASCAHAFRVYDLKYTTTADDAKAFISNITRQTAVSCFCDSVLLIYIHAICVIP